MPVHASAEVEPQEGADSAVASMQEGKDAVRNTAAWSGDNDFGWRTIGIRAGLL